MEQQDDKCRRRRPKRVFPTSNESLSVYSFRCPRLMDSYMEQLMGDHTVNRTQVIRLGVYMLAAFSEWEENKGLPLHELVRRMEARTPSPFPPYEAFSEP